MSNILALQMVKPYLETTNTGYQGQVGYRPVLAVTFIVAKLQTTVLYGNDLYGIGLMSNLDEQTIFREFVSSFSHLGPWAQLAEVPNPVVAYPRVTAQQYRQVLPPIATGLLSVLSAGFDPAHGYWVEFAGNYFLTFPIFKNWPSLVRDTLNYRGFEPSANNPGTPGGTGGSGTGGSGTPGSGGSGPIIRW